jgi:predicted RNA-binding Zn-ribbon protein involved in translation (DUF1610 family)
MNEIVIVGSLVAIFVLICVAVKTISVSTKFKKGRRYLDAVCSNCGERLIDPNANDCPKCGATFVSKTQRTLCPNCGSEIRGVLKKKCTNCGEVFLS